MSEAERSVAQFSEVSLVQRMSSGEDAAVAEFYQVYSGALFHFVYRRVNEQFEDAEEIAQDTFLSALSLAETYDESCSVFTWLCGIAKLRIVDYYRHQRREKRIPLEKILTPDAETLRLLQECAPSVTSVDDVLNRLDAARLVDVMMAALSEDERESLILRYVEELSVREIAALLKRTEKAIEGLLMRAKKKAVKAAAEWE